MSIATRRKIAQNLIWAFAYNVVSVPLVAFGIVSPVVASAAMALSSVLVVSNSLLLRRWKAKGGPGGMTIANAAAQNGLMRKAIKRARV